MSGESWERERVNWKSERGSEETKTHESVQGSYRSTAVYTPVLESGVTKESRYQPPTA